MSVLINADTSDGLKFTSDTSGEIKLQSAGADIATVNSSGITMASGKTLPAAALTGTLPAIDGSSLTGVGKILQVVNATSTSFASTTSTSFVDTNLSASITPSSSSNKILVLVQGQAYIAAGGSTTQMISTILRNSTNLGDADRGMMQNVYQGNASMIYLDSPNTTSSITYKVQFKLQSGANTVYFGVDGTPQTMTLMEIAG